MILTDLLAHTGQPDFQPGLIAQIDVSGLQFDSRNVKPGDLFVAIKGDCVDGHQFIHNAINNGAVAVVGTESPLNISVPYYQLKDTRLSMAYLAAAFYGHPARQMTVIGVTGTDGKTTTVNLIYQILLAAGIKAAMISTVNAVIGNDSIDTGFHVTTPESPTIQHLFRQMLDAGSTHVVVEATSHGLEQHRVTACDFDLGVVTNITHEHLDYHGDYQGYLNAKSHLFTSLIDTPEKSVGNYRTATLNRDDISYQPLNKILSDPIYSTIRQISYGHSQEADIFAESISQTMKGLHFIVRIGDQCVEVDSPLIGEYNVDNILAAISTAALGLKLDIKNILTGIRNLSYVPGRMEKIELGQPFTAIVDFAHTPNALKVALMTARRMCQKRIIAVFGSAGLRDREKRRLMAAVSIKLADMTILTAEDPRTENLDDILSEMAGEAQKNGGIEGANFLQIADRGEAIRRAVKMAGPDDLVIACGKGHEQSMCFGTTEYAWDDRSAMRSALSELLGISGQGMPYLPTQK